MIFEIFIILIAGFGAGVITGLIGASAVLIAAPLMVLFLGFDGYTAIGVSLGIDVIASLVAAITFYQHNNLRVKPGLVMAFFAIIGAFIGSYFSSFFPSAFIIKVTGIAIFFTGLRLCYKSIPEEAKELKEVLHPGFSKNTKLILYIIAGLVIGLIGGIFGAGGGLSILLVLMFVSKYRTHTAVGTSVFVMTFLALSGAVGHYIYGSFLIYAVVVGSIGAVVGSFLAAVYANRVSEKTLNRIAGFIVMGLGVVMAVREFLI